MCQKSASPPLARADIANQSLSLEAQTWPPTVSQHCYSSGVNGMLNLICIVGDRYFVRTFPTPASWGSVSLEACVGKAWIAEVCLNRPTYLPCDETTT